MTTDRLRLNRAARRLEAQLQKHGWIATITDKYGRMTVYTDPAKFAAATGQTLIETPYGTGLMMGESDAPVSEEASRAWQADFDALSAKLSGDPPEASG